MERAWDEGWIHPEPPEQARASALPSSAAGPRAWPPRSSCAAPATPSPSIEKNDRIGGLLRYGIPELQAGKAHHRPPHRADARRRRRLRAPTLTSASSSGRRPSPRTTTPSCFAAAPSSPATSAFPAASSRASTSPWSSCPSRIAAARRHCRSRPIAILATGKQVIIIGGGDTGADCLGTSHRQGAKSVHQFEIMPKPPGTARRHHAVAALALQLRTESSHEEGGIRDWSIGTVEIHRRRQRQRPAASRHSCRPSAQVRAHRRQRVHARRRPGATRHGFPRSGHATA